MTKLASSVSGFSAQAYKIRLTELLDQIVLCKWPVEIMYMYYMHCAGGSSKLVHVHWHVIDNMFQVANMSEEISVLHVEDTL